MDKSASVLLGLLSSSLGKDYSGEDMGGMSGQDWERLVGVSLEHGVAALTANEYCDLGCSSLIDTAEFDGLRLKWFGKILSTEAEYRYKLKKADAFARALQEKGVVCNVLKGMSFGTYYSHPEFRECGDCDVYLGDGWKTGNEVAVQTGGRYEFGTYKHSHLYFGRLMVENHRYLTDFDGTRQGKKIELLLEGAISETSGRPIGDTCLICPADYFNALFLIKHAHGNFMHLGLTLRMIYDWAALLKCCREKLDWSRLYSDLTECRLREFARLLTSLCAEYLGVEVGSEVELCDDKALVREVMEDTLSGGIHIKGTETFMKKSIRLFRRFLRIWHYRSLATESVSRMIWNNFAFSSYMKRKIEL